MAIIMVRTVIVFIGVVVAMRLMGKRQLGELELNELVVAVLISDIASHPLQDIGIPLMNGLLPAVVLLCCELIIAQATMKKAAIRKLVCGTPSILVQNGVVMEPEMRKNRFTLDELAEELRNQSVTDISKIKYAILETNGQLNVILFAEHRPATVGDLNLPYEDKGYAHIVINDGELLPNNLQKAGKDDKWLARELKKRDVKSPKQVYLLSVDKSGSVYYQAKEKVKK